MTKSNEHKLTSGAPADKSSADSPKKGKTRAKAPADGLDFSLDSQIGSEIFHPPQGEFTLMEEGNKCFDAHGTTRSLHEGKQSNLEEKPSALSTESAESKLSQPKKAPSGPIKSSLTPFLVSHPYGHHSDTIVMKDKGKSRIGTLDSGNISKVPTGESQAKVKECKKAKSSARSGLPSRTASSRAGKDPASEKGSSISKVTSSERAASSTATSKSPPNGQKSGVYRLYSSHNTKVTNRSMIDMAKITKACIIVVKVTDGKTKAKDAKSPVALKHKPKTKDSARLLKVGKSKSVLGAKSSEASWSVASSPSSHSKSSAGSKSKDSSKESSSASSIYKMPPTGSKGAKGNRKCAAKANDHSRSASKESSKSKQSTSGSKGVNKSVSKEFTKTEYFKAGSTWNKSTSKTVEFAGKSKHSSNASRSESQDGSKSQIASQSGTSFVSKGSSNSKSSNDSSKDGSE